MCRNILIQFVGEMQKKYPNIIFRFEYDKEEDAYRIWHTHGKAQEDKQFMSHMGTLIRDLFIQNKFFNFYLDYNAKYSTMIHNVDQWVSLASNSKQPHTKWMNQQLSTVEHHNHEENSYIVEAA